MQNISKLAGCFHCLRLLHHAHHARLAVPVSPSLQQHLLQAYRVLNQAASLIRTCLEAHSAGLSQQHPTFSCTSCMFAVCWCRLQHDLL